LPLGPVLKRYTMTCPQCARDIEVKRMSAILPLAVAVAVVLLMRALLKTAAVAGPASAVATVAIAAAASLPVYLLTVRYRAKP
jgi:hypothetical protein